MKGNIENIQIIRPIQVLIQRPFMQIIILDKI